MNKHYAKKTEVKFHGFKELIAKGIHFTDVELTTRLVGMVMTHSNYLWLNKKHRMNMSETDYLLGFHQHRNTNAYYAAIYLMVSNQDLVERCRWCVSKEGIDFSMLRLSGISPQNYALLMAAKEIYTGKEYFTEQDLANPEIIDINTFRLIITSKLIKQFGVNILKDKNGGEYIGCN